jgi:hypothetical protein
MRIIVAVSLVGLGLGMSTLVAQTGAPLTVPAPVVPVPASAITAPGQAPSVQPKATARPQRARQTQKPVVEDTTPGPRSNRQNTRVRATPPPPATAAISYADALKHQHHQRHDRGWWTTRYRTIVLVNGAGYYYWDAGYWFPAYGYDPEYENYDYDGPIYTYGNLLPDQVIYNVQRALKDLGYYSGPLTGSYSAATRTAIRAFQADNGLDTTGAIDAPTIDALGLYSS